LDATPRATVVNDRFFLFTLLMLIWCSAGFVNQNRVGSSSTGSSNGPLGEWLAPCLQNKSQQFDPARDLENRRDSYYGIPAGLLLPIKSRFGDQAIEVNALV